MDIAVPAPVRQLRAVDRVDEIVLDERLLHAADDVDHVVCRRAATADEDVEDRRGRVADRDEIDRGTARRGVFRPVAGIADADIGEVDHGLGLGEGRHQPTAENKAGAAEQSRRKNLPTVQ